MALSTEAQLEQLANARKIVLGDTTYYPQIITSLLPVIKDNPRLAIRRWGADFVAEAFASPLFARAEKEKVALFSVDVLKTLLGKQDEDNTVLKSAVQAAASIYPLVVRWIINNKHDTTTWDRMLAIKSRIFKIWDTAAPGIRICCIKFAQRIVLVQTRGPEAELKTGSPEDVSLTLVPQDNDLLIPRNLEAEASGLLDRILAVFQENSSDAVLIDATLNSLSTLIRLRPNLANKILNVLLNFNPLKLANSPMTPKLRVMVRSMEKTTRALLVHILKRDPQSPLAGRIHQYVERMMRSKSEIFDEAIKKRGPPEPTDGLDERKRQKLGAQIPPIVKVHVPPLTPGTHTIAELFTVTEDEALKAFDVGQIPEDLVVKIGIIILQRIDPDLLDQTINGIRARYLSMQRVQTEELNPATAMLGVEDDDDDYEPDFYPAGEDTEQILNKLDKESPEVSSMLAPDVTLGPFTLPPPPPLAPEQVAEMGEQTIARVIGTMQDLEDQGNKKTKAGINRLAASTYDREAWLTIVTRLATRCVAGLEESSPVKDDPSQNKPLSLSSSIRESLYIYILEDFRKRIDVAVAWLCEEWYNDRIAQRLGEQYVVPHYEKLVLRVLDGIVPYLDAKDKVLTRFLSEIPALNQEILDRVKQLCRNPAMVGLALTSLLYLVMMKPPVREMALDAVQDVWVEYDDAKPLASKYLTKWRPGLIERMSADAVKEDEGELKEEYKDVDLAVIA